MDCYDKMRVIISLDDNFSKLNINEVYHFLIHKMSGIVREHFLSLEQIKRDYMIASLDKMNLTNRVLDEILQEFVGIDSYRPEVIESTIQEAFWHISNMNICNLCYLD